MPHVKLPDESVAGETQLVHFTEVEVHDKQFALQSEQMMPLMNWLVPVQATQEPVVAGV